LGFSWDKKILEEKITSGLTQKGNNLMTADLRSVIDKHNDMDRNILNVIHELTDIEKTYRDPANRTENKDGEILSYNDYVAGLLVDRFKELSLECLAYLEYHDQFKQ
jgi:hypothetical protein